jgi:hypothetical protein
MMAAPGQSMAAWMESRVARFSTRKYDWDALKFQADYDPSYRRAQMRYVGTGGPAAKQADVEKYGEALTKAGLPEARQKLAQLVIN